MTKLPLSPPEIGELAPCRSFDGLAPRFRSKIDMVLADMVACGWQPTVRESTRSEARAKHLYNFGRVYDDGRGIVTNAPNALKTWHRYGLAVDIGDRRYDDEHTPAQFWKDLERIVMAHGLTSGADWNRNGIHDEKLCDGPHVQWFVEGMHVTPSDHAAELLSSSGVEAVWAEVRAA